MQVQRTSTLQEYLTKLRENAEEAQALFADLLISVTTFFRDAAAFQKLAEIVLPKLFGEKGSSHAIRIWVAGCATGEEAYSIAMLLMEEADRHEYGPELQVFATDLDGVALAAAREGRYPLSIEADMSEERLRRFFTRDIDSYHVRRELRDIVLFAKHSLLKDPPFSRLDLVSCRNLLIYLDRELQQQVCATIHLGLRAGGFLFLGSSESADSSAGMFHLIDRDARIYERMPSAGGGARVVQALATVGAAPEPLPDRLTVPFRAPAEAAMHREALERAAPPSVVVDGSFRVVHLSETAGRYLQPSAGVLTNDITDLAREELRFDLRAALHRAFSHGEPSLSAPIAVRFNGHQQRVYVQVRPLPSNPHESQSALVFFFEGEALSESPVALDLIEQRAPEEQIRELQQELQFTQAQLRTSREEYEGANEELRAANEELQSINEEYRSTGEELETSKEELQSINEELQTVNSELKAKLESASRANSDIQNLLAATDVGILFVDAQLRIKRFTPLVAELFNVTSGDEGRLITDFTHRLDYDDLGEDARTVLRDLASREREVRSKNGNWYLLRLRPYRTIENKIDGVVVTLVDFTERRRAEDALRESEARARSVLDGVADAIITINETGLIQSVNRATTKLFGYSVEELVGKDVSLLLPDPHSSKHEGYIQNYLRTGTAKIIGMDREVEGRRKNGSLLPAELTVSEISHGGERLFIGFIRDLSATRKFEARLDKLHKNRLSSMSEVVGALAHEINQPLAVATTYLQAARRQCGALDPKSSDIDGTLNSAAAELVRAARIIGQLREFISRGDPEKSRQNMHLLIRQACDFTASGMQKANVECILRLHATEDVVFVDKVQIQQVLVNLIRNAKEAMSNSETRKLTILTEVKNGDIQTDVVDTGCGVPEPARADLFQPFTTTKTNGLGVGLSISHSIVEDHYGKLWAEPNPGGGSKFSFTLPLAGAAPVVE